MLKNGQQIGHYKILSAIGAGGMGEVFLAEDARLKRKVALKILSATLGQDKERLHRFEKEACAASALNHPNILTIHEFSSYNGISFIATEYIKGETLRERISREPLSLREALEVAIQIAAALNVAHEAGIVHRDIKPENIMLRDDGLVKVLDFGLAKLAEKKRETVESEDATRAQVNTNPGMVMGTVAYMSPEQARGKVIDTRSDIWSLGVCLYEMLTGRTPFAEETINDTIAAILKAEPSPLEESFPAELHRIIRKALQKKADERYQTVKDFLLDLKNLKRELEFSEEIERSHIPAFAKSSNVRINQSGENRTANQAAAISTQNSISQQASSAEYIVSEVKKHKFAWLGVSVAMLTALLVGGYFVFFSKRAAAFDSIAVLPFVNESRNADTEYLSDGMTETLISSLSQLPNLNVKARSSVFRYKGKETDPKQIAKELDVQAVLMGRVVQRGQDLSLYVELVDVVEDKVIWSQSYNRPLTSLVSLQSEIARDVSQKLKMKLSGADEQKLAKISTENDEAYKLYLKGRFYLNKRTEEGIGKGIEYFNQAIKLDPNYALAYSGLADSYGLLNVFGYAPSPEMHPKQKAAAVKAVELDPTLAEARTSLGFAKQLESDFSGSKIEYQRAVELNPNYATAYHWNALNYYAGSGMDEQRDALLKRALELDPLSLQINTEYAHSLYAMKKYDEAAAQAKKTLEIDPNYFNAHAQLGLIYSNLGKHQEAIEEMNRMLAVSENVGALAHMAYVQARAGNKEKARQILEQLNLRAQREYVHPQFFALIYFGLGDKDQVFLQFNKICETRVPVLLALFSPDWEDLYSDPRFARIRKCLNFAT